jgi:hypothetical protein
MERTPEQRKDDAHEAPVDVRSDAAALDFLRKNQAVAAAVDRDTVLVEPSLRTSQSVVSHELAHIAQLRSGIAASRESAEDAAHRASPGASRSTLGGAPSPPLFLTVAEQIAKAPSKGDVFDLLRGLPAGSGDTADVKAAIVARFTDQPDDCWLALRIAEHGPETLWPADLVADRSKRAAAGKWAPEAGNIEADLTTPGDTAHSVRAYFFPGSDPEKRALVFAGVHQSEPEGTDVAEKLRARLATDSAAGRPPAYTTIVVPNLFEDRHLKGPLADRRKIGKQDPNRNFPGDVAPNVKGGSDATKDAAGHAILAENRILMALVERFRPQRVASIHAHSLKDVQGDAPGIFVDPQAGPQGAKDVDAAKDAARAVAAGAPAAAASKDPGKNPLIGNYAQPGPAGGGPLRAANDPNVLYSPSAKHDPGVSAGGWFPSASSTPPASAGAARTTRDPVSIYTVEVPEWRSGADAKALPAVEELEAKALEEILLGAQARP